MSDEPSHATQPVTVIYTGTRPPRLDAPNLHLVHLPMLEAAAVDFDPREVQILVRQPCTLVFYSQNSVDVVADSGVLAELDLDDHQVWSVGQKTAESVQARFGVPAKVPEDERFEGLVEAFSTERPPGPIVAFALEDSPRRLSGALPESQEAHDIPVYRTCPRLHPGLSETLADTGAAWVVFTSPRGVGTFVSQAGAADLDALKLAAIGPTTAAALQARELSADLVAETPDKDHLIRQLLAQHFSENQPT